MTDRELDLTSDRALAMGEAWLAAEAARRRRLQPRAVTYPELVAGARSSITSWELAARRSRDEAARRHADALRRRNRGYGIVYGVIFAALVIIALLGGL